MLLRDGSLFVVFMAAWLVLGIGSTLYVRSRRTAVDKRRAHRIVSVFAGAVFGVFVISVFPSAAFFMLPAILLITWLNLRNTHFCDQCGKMTQMQPFQQTNFCPRCGAVLPAD